MRMPPGSRPNHDSAPVQPARFVTHRFGLDEILDAYDMFSRAAETDALKVALSRRQATGEPRT
jgi:threonine dehydrogenase-like Zn-dependent dehydrogenase